MKKQEALFYLKNYKINPNNIFHMEALRTMAIGEVTKPMTDDEAVKHLEGIKDISGSDIAALIIIVLKILKDSGVIKKPTESKSTAKRIKTQKEK